MLKYIIVPGLVYQGEADEQAAQRDRAMQKHNDMVEDLEAKAKLPMNGYREWARERGILND